MRSYILFALLAMFAAPCFAGKLYRCDSNKVRYYVSKPIPGATCAVISYSGRTTPPAMVDPPNGWTFVGSSVEADFYVQDSSIVRNKGEVGAWLAEGYRAHQTNRYTRSPFLSALRRISVKCQDRQIATNKITYTSEAFGRGNYVGEYRPLGTGYFDYATPGSVDDAVVSFLCTTTKKQTQARPEAKPRAQLQTRSFHGYVCSSDCSGHKAGYEWAEGKGITDPEVCSGNSRSFIEGCRAWAEEN